MNTGERRQLELKVVDATLEKSEIGGIETAVVDVGRNKTAK